MSVVIRLARGGAKKAPFYRIVAADRRMPRDGRFIEKLGTYDPMLPQGHEQRVTFNQDRVQYWLGQGAKASDRVHRLLAAAGAMPAFTWTDTPKKSEPGTKAKERAEERKAKEEAAREAAEAAAAETTEAPAEGEAAPAEGEAAES